MEVERQGSIVDVGAILDAAPVGRFQILVGIGCALAALVDGMDYQSIGIAAPLIAADLGLAKGDLGPLLSAGQLGAMIGALFMGLMGDGFGRRTSLIVSLAIVTVGTAVAALAPNLGWLTICRFVAGLGLGGATPCFVSLTAEYFPAQRRSMAVATMWAAFPLGGVLGSFINPYIGQTFGWHAIFQLGALLPLALVLIFTACLPESVRYLAVRRTDPRRIKRILDRIAPQREDAHFTLHEGDQAEIRSISGFLCSVQWRSTALLWLIFIITFSALLFQPLWVPTLLTGPGSLSLSGAGLVIAMSNLGSVFGTAAFGRVLDRAPLGKAMVLCYLLAAIFVLLVGSPTTEVRLPAIGAFVSCFLLGGASAGALALATWLYPTHLRATGVGLAMAMARLGQVVSALLFGWMLQLNATSFQIFTVVAVAISLAVAPTFFLSRLVLKPAQSF